jgi:hypothetical protein
MTLNDISRRQWLGMAGLFGAGGVAAAMAGVPGERGNGGASFFNVRQHGAVADGATLDTAAINRAIDAAAAAGGGLVYVPPGIYLVGTIVLKSNITLYLEAGATLQGSTKISDYSAFGATPEQGDANRRHLIFAQEADNVTLAGPGRIDGQGPAFWVPSGRKPLPPEEEWRDVAAHVSKALPRASPLLEFFRCRNLRIEGVRIENAQGWTLRPIDCDNVVIRGISIKNPVIGSNTDGIDPTCCHNVFISDCVIDTGDDAICLKSENPYGGELRVSKNITITNCVLTTCCNGLKFGTATHGGFENIAFTNSIIYNNAVGLKARVIAGIAIEMVDGGWVEGVTISNIRMQRVRTPIFIRHGNRRPRHEGSPGTLRGIMIENVHATGSILTSSVTGLPGFEVEDVTLSNVRIDSEEVGAVEWAARSIPELAPNYPEARMFGRLPAYGLYARHVQGLRVRGLDVHPAPTEARPLLAADDVSELEVEGLRGRTAPGASATVKLINCREVSLRGCTAPEAAGSFLDVEGQETKHVALLGSDLSGCELPAKIAASVPNGAVRLGGNVLRG